jgi:hypothetical protein
VKRRGRRELQKRSCYEMLTSRELTEQLTDRLHVSDAFEETEKVKGSAQHVIEDKRCE